MIALCNYNKEVDPQQGPKLAIMLIIALCAIASIATMFIKEELKRINNAEDAIHREIADGNSEDRPSEVNKASLLNKTDTCTSIEARTNQSVSQK